jgi:hypothetical protein
VPLSTSPGLSPKKEPHRRVRYQGSIPRLLILCLIVLTTSCTLPLKGTPPTNATIIAERSPTPSHDRSSPEWVALNSLEKVNPHPLYVMTYAPDKPLTHHLSDTDHPLRTEAYPQGDICVAWGCSLFVTLNDQHSLLFGRNFDWHYSPALLLFYDPVEGYPSVAMTDLAYLMDDEIVQRLDELSVEQRSPLLNAVHLPFDGMNAKGLVIAIAAVPDSPLPQDPRLETLNSLSIIRRVLDHAGDVEEALEIFATIKPDWGQGPALHYLISDRSGRSVLVEFIAGKMVLLENQEAWQAATNFLQHSPDADHSGQCWRYDLLVRELRQHADSLTMGQAMELLASVAQKNPEATTQWSIVYDFDRGDVNITMEGKYSDPYQVHFARFSPVED